MQREWYLKNRKHVIEKSVKWQKENKEKLAAKNKRARKKFATMLHAIKINGCAICGYDKCTCSLDFHHVNSENKKFNCGINGLIRHSSKDYVNEISKCILLCRNCHGEIHALKEELE